MRNPIKLILLLVCYIYLSNFCIGQNSNNTNTDKQNAIRSKIDSVSLSQIKENVDHEEKKYQTIFDYYELELQDNVEIWSDKMLGRCCSETDYLYSELLSYKISTNVNNATYPDSNLSDHYYRTTFAFKENQKTEIYLKLDRDNYYHAYMTNLKLDEVLKTNDTILSPFKMSLVNGYTKSQKTFKQNGRVKTMKIFLNNNYKGLVTLLDTPIVQEFELDFMFFRNDTIKLVPVTYYKGSKYDDICISEIQSSLAHITHPSINKKYIVEELRKE